MHTITLRRQLLVKKGEDYSKSIQVDKQIHLVRQ